MKRTANARNPKFLVDYGFICNDGNLAGRATTKELKFTELEFALAMVDPFNHEKWMNDIRYLRRKGEHIVITMNSASDSYGNVGRVIKITRN